MTRTSLAVLLAGMLACGCQKEKGAGGAAAGGGGSALDFPADTTAVVGFVRKGPAPSAAELTAAVKALIEEELDQEITLLIDACIAPVTAHLERTTVVVRGELKEERVVAFGSGAGLRPALEACFKSLAEKRGKSFAPVADGDHTLYTLGGGDPLVARWTGADQVVFAASKEEIASAVAPGGLAGTPLEKVMAGVDRSAAIWFAAAGPHLPPQADLESASGSIQELTGSVRAVFKTPEGASQAKTIVEMAIPKGVKAAGKEVTIGLNVADLPRVMISGKPGTPPRPPLSREHARALVAAGPLVLSFFFIVGGEERSATPPPPPTETAPAPQPAEPPQPVEPPPP